MQVLPRRVVGLLLDLRPRARATPHPPNSRLVCRRHRLGLPSPDLQDTHKEVIAVHDASLQGVIAKTSSGDYRHARSTFLRRNPEESCSPKGIREVRTAPYLFTCLLLGGALREPCKLAL